MDWFISLNLTEGHNALLAVHKTEVIVVFILYPEFFDSYKVTVGYLSHSISPTF